MKRFLLLICSILPSFSCEDPYVAPAEEQLAAYAEVYCFTMQKCCPDTFTEADHTYCMMWYASNFQRWTRGDLEIHRLKKCLDARRKLLARSCDAELDFRLRECLNLVELPEHYSDVDYGCGVDRHCPVYMYCDVRNEQTEDGIGAVCARRKGAGETCDDGGGSRVCPDGLVCRTLAGAQSATCEPFLELGETCINPYECGSRFNFEVSCIGGVCAKLLGDGTFCDPHSYSDCISGFCNPETSLCEPLTLHRYCLNRSQVDKTFDMYFGRRYSRY